jgi:hypothetical protein
MGVGEIHTLAFGAYVAGHGFYQYRHSTRVLIGQEVLAEMKIVVSAVNKP